MKTLSIIRIVSGEGRLYVGGVGLCKGGFPCQKVGWYTSPCTAGSPNSFSYLMLSIVIAWTCKDYVPILSKSVVPTLRIYIFFSQSIIYFVVDIHTLNPANWRDQLCFSNECPWNKWAHGFRIQSFFFSPQSFIYSLLYYLSMNESKQHAWHGDLVVPECPVTLKKYNPKQRLG